MEKMNALTLIITLVVGVILTGALLAPVINDASETERTFLNEGYFTMDKIANTDTDTHSIVWDASENGRILTVDGVEMDIANWGLGSYQFVTVFASETDMIRLGVVSGEEALSWIQIRGSSIAYAGAVSYFSASFANGELSALIDAEETPVTATYSEAFIINDSNDGAYVMKKSTESAYMLADSPIYAIGNTDFTYNEAPANLVLKISGNIEGVEITTLQTNLTGVTITYGDTVIDAPAHNGYIGLYDFSKITFTATIGSTTQTFTYSYVIVPTEVTAELAHHLTPGQISLMGAIPVMVIVALLMIAVGVIAYRRAD